MWYSYYTDAKELLFSPGHLHDTVDLKGILVRLSYSNKYLKYVRLMHSNIADFGDYGEGYYMQFV